MNVTTSLRFIRLQTRIRFLHREALPLLVEARNEFLRQRSVATLSKRAIIQAVVDECAASLMHLVGIGNLNSDQELDSFQSEVFERRLTALIQEEEGDVATDFERVADGLLSSTEETIKACEETLDPYKPRTRQGLPINDASVAYGCVTNNDQWGYGLYSMHADRADAEHNARITGGVACELERDPQIGIVVPLEVRLALNLTSAAV